MQNRMKTHPLTAEQMDQLLSRVSTGSLATLNEDGSPYVTPVHFIMHDGCIYFHGLPKGQKIDNMKRDSRVSMAIYEMDGLLLDAEGKPCDTNTKYQSIIVAGTASLVEDIAQKRTILSEIVRKYTPRLAVPESMVKGTAVVKIQITDIAGKYYG